MSSGLLFVVLGAGALLPSPPDAIPSSATATPPTTLRPFQPGVWIDWTAQTVEVETRVVLRSGPLEFFACWPGKEHESILRFEAAALHVFLALGLVGLEPGYPPRWNEAAGRFDDPTGARLDLRVRWLTDGLEHEADAYEWLRAVEYGRTPLPRPWIFAGSLRLSDGDLAAQRSGVGIALVDFPDSLIAYSRRFPSRYGALWAEVHTPAVPPEGTPVRLRIRAAAALHPAVELDALGDAHLEGRYCPPEDLLDILRHTHTQNSITPLSIRTRGTLRSDVEMWRVRLKSAGLPSDWVRFVAVEPGGV